MATGRIELGVEDRKLLEGRSRAQRVEHRLKIRSQIILKAAEGCSGREIGKSLSIPEVTVSKWRRRFCGQIQAGHSPSPASPGIPRVHEPSISRTSRRGSLVELTRMSIFISLQPTPPADQIEIWFSILSRRALQGANFTSVAQLRHAIDEFIKNYNRDAAPFEWTKSQVHQVGLTKHISNLRN